MAEDRRQGECAMMKGSSGYLRCTFFAMTLRLLPSVCFSACVGFFALAAAGPALAAPAGGASKPEMRVSLGPLGYRPLASHMLLSGYVLQTVDFVDDQHLLVTFNERKLLPRLPDQRDDDQDHQIRVVLLHLPDGKLIAETEWRVHDPLRYMWPLTEGRFLIRIRNSFSILDPLHGRRGQELERTLLMANSRRVEHVQVSPDGSMVAVQTSPAKHINDDEDAPRPKEPIELKLYTLSSEIPVRLLERGGARLERAVALSITEYGIIEAVAEKTGEWGFDLHGFHGEEKDLAGLESSCRPQSTFVSATEFLVSACRGGDERGMMAGLNLRGEVMWMAPTAPPRWVSFSFAPKAGRFALRNAITVNGRQTLEDESDVAVQEVRVYQAYSGVELLRVVDSPTQRADQNFALSPDGLHLAVWKGDGIEVYRLPALSTKDMAEVKRAHEPVTMPAAQK
jgi:hypothetical protein